MEYFICKSSSTEELSKEVNKMLKEGWQLRGELLIAQEVRDTENYIEGTSGALYPNHLRDRCTMYCQCLEKQWQ